MMSLSIFAYPATKGKTLEEIEAHFASGKPASEL